MAQYARSFALEINEDPFSDADYTDINNNFELKNGNLLPGVNNGQWQRMAYTGESVDRLADSIYVEVTLGIGPSVYSDLGGPALIVNGGADNGKGYHVRQNGNNVSVYQIDTNGSTGTSLGIGTIISAATGGRVGLEIYQINSSPRIRMYYNDVVAGSSASISDYVDEVVPGISAIWGDSQYRGWTAIAIDGLDLGGFRLDDVNSGTDVIQNNDSFTINGDFDSTTITSVTLIQSGATNKTATIDTQDNSTVVCDAIDFHGTEIMGGAVTVSVYDGTDTLTIDVSLDFSDDWTVDTAAGIAPSGYTMWQDIPGAAIGDISHWPPTIGGSPTTVDETTMRASLMPHVPNDTLFTAWHGDVSTHTWTSISGNWSQFDDVGPKWATPPAWLLTHGVSDTYDVTGLVTDSNGAMTYALAAESGFSIAAGIITYDGTAEAGSYWLSVTGTDADGTTTCPQIAVTIEPYPLQLSNDSVTSIGQHTATITVDALTADGDIYAAVRTTGAYTDSDIAAIKAGTSAVWYQDKESALTLPFYITALDADTTLYYGVVQSDGGLDSNVLAGTFDTLEEISFADFGKAPVVRP